MCIFSMAICQFYISPSNISPTMLSPERFHQNYQADIGRCWVQSSSPPYLQEFMSLCPYNQYIAWLRKWTLKYFPNNAFN